MADEYEEVQEQIERYIKALYDKKTKDRYKLIEEFRAYLLKEPHPPYLNLDQIVYILVGEEGTDTQGGLCQICQEKSGIIKTIKRSAQNALTLIHSLLFKKDYYLKEQV